MVCARTRLLPIVVYSLLMLPVFAAGAAAPVAAQSAEPAAAQKRKAPPKGRKAEKSVAATEPRDASEIESAIATAQKSLDAGKADAAVSQVDALIAKGGLEPNAMARALAVRGQGYKLQGRPAQAIADLQGALWIKNGLGDAERAKVSEARAEAYREAGLGAPATGSGSARSAPTSPATAASSTTSSTPSRQTAPPPTTPVVTAAIPAGRPEPAAPATSSNSGLGGFFSNLFGSGAPKQPEQPAKDTRQLSREAPANPAVSSWSEPAKVKPAPSPAPTPTAVAPPAKKPTVVAAATARDTTTDARQPESFVLRLAAQRSPQEAKQVAERIKRAYAAEIGNRGYRIDESTFGNMGRFYLADVGPFDDFEGARALCASIRNSGTDCHVVGQ